MVGQPIAANPMRLDLEEAGGMLKPPVFILNAVLDGAGAVWCGWFAGIPSMPTVPGSNCARPCMGSKPRRPMW